MRILVLALLLSGCSTVTVNGADVARLSALSIVGAVGVAVLMHEEDKPREKHFRCPSCMPIMKEEMQ